jgi:RNA polymerase sigma-70 factor (ECF subfamily)
VWNANRNGSGARTQVFCFQRFDIGTPIALIFLVWHETICEEDKDFIRRCQAGDEQAFESLVRKYERELFHLVSWHVGSAADAEDLVQEIFCKVYFSLDKFDNDRPFYPWLRRVAINQCYDELRRVRRRKVLKFTELNDQDTRLIERLMAVPQAETVDSMQSNSEELRLLMQKVLERLPEKQRMAIVLRDFKQVSYEEMAETMGCSRQAVRLKVFRARARLRTMITKALRRQEKLHQIGESSPYRGAKLTPGEAEA